MSFSARGSVSGKITINPSPTTSDYAIVMPPQQGEENTVLQNDGTGTLSWVTIPSGENSGGDVVGPASATDNAVVRFNTTTGKRVQNSGVRISDTGEITGPRSLGLRGSTSGVLTLRASDTTTNYTVTMPTEQGAEGTLLQNNGSGVLSWASGLRLINIQTFVSVAGNYTYTPTAGTKRALVYVTGGGGAGGGAGGTPNTATGSGGNSGATIIGLYSIDSVSVGTVTIGAGGQGVSGGIGGAGGASSFLYPDSLFPLPSGQITANGGAGGTRKSAVSGNIAFIMGPNSNRATTTNTSINDVLLGVETIEGTIGESGYIDLSDVAIGGIGADSFWGGGGAPGVLNDVTNQSAGLAAAIDSGSGGGGSVQSNKTASTGGAGGRGRCVIYEFVDPIFVPPPPSF